MHPECIEPLLGIDQFNSNYHDYISMQLQGLWDQDKAT